MCVCVGGGGQCVRACVVCVCMCICACISVSVICMCARVVHVLFECACDCCARVCDACHRNTLWNVYMYVFVCCCFTS